MCDHVVHCVSGLSKVSSALAVRRHSVLAKEQLEVFEFKPFSTNENFSLFFGPSILPDNYE